MDKIKKRIKVLTEMIKTETEVDKKVALQAGINALKKQIPKKPIQERWNPSRCPCCDAELSELLGDGYYRDYNDKEICDCGQKLKWY
jgi:hypothetical protein